ncbi:MAG: hypothetical protein B7Z37_06785 [Verrucomicrobia bacterium 12-59-8]|nr:MAG: hypothetical protein B7Z37_06785 [Verrucomicrobia bacterium 12-59-8]
MKTQLILLSALCLVQFPLHAQVTVAEPIATPANVVVVRPGTVVVQPMDPAATRRQLSMAPKVVIVTPATQAAGNTTQATRVYNAERGVVVVEDQGQSRELPYVMLPVLFEVGTARLLDNESRVALQQVADVILAVSKTEPGSVYDIEGHTSSDGPSAVNMDLSAARAKRVFEVLTQNYGIPASSLSAHGYGEIFPMYPNGNEAELQQDRRVLVVRTK